MTSPRKSNKPAFRQNIPALRQQPFRARAAHAAKIVRHCAIFFQFSFSKPRNYMSKLKLAGLVTLLFFQNILLAADYPSKYILGFDLKNDPHLLNSPSEEMVDGFVPDLRTFL
jgi:hypothetical protein